MVPSFSLTLQQVPSVELYFASHGHISTSIYCQRAYNKILEIIPTFINDIHGDDTLQMVSELSRLTALAQSEEGLTECSNMILAALTDLSGPIAANDCVYARKIVTRLTPERITLDVYRSI